MSALEKAHRLKKQAFVALDRSKTGSTVRVDYNELIDVCLAFEEAAKGDTENLEFANALLSEQVHQFRRILDRIADNVPVDSPAWKLCFSEYAPEFNVDPEACLAKVRGYEKVDKDAN